MVLRPRVVSGVKAIESSKKSRTEVDPLNLAIGKVKRNIDRSNFRLKNQIAVKLQRREKE